MKLDEIQKRLLREVADLHEVPEGAYNIRSNSKSAGRQSTANIEIIPKTDVSGMDIRIKPGTKNESVHIPVVMTESGLKEVVYNDFFIGEDADVTIVAGCGIDNCGNQDSQHDGIHRFFVGKNAHPLCGKALRLRRRQGQAHPEPGDGGLSGGGQHRRNGDGADQGRGRHDPHHQGRAGRQRQAGGPRAPDDPRPAERRQHLRGQPERRRRQRGRGLPLRRQG